MNLWIGECLRIFRIILGNPASDVELWVLTGLGAISLILTIYKIGDLLGAHQASKARATIIMIISVAAMLAAVAAINFYVAPRLTHHHDIRRYLPIAAAVAVLFVVSTPLMCVIQRTSYFSGLFSLLLSAAVAAVVIALGSTAFNAISTGSKDLNKQKDRKETINKLIE